MGVALPQAEPLAVLADRLGGALDAELRDTVVTRLAAAGETAASGDLVVLTAPRLVPVALAAGAPLLCSEAVAPRVPVGRRWVHGHVLWVVSQLLGAPPPYPPEGRASSQVHPEARVDASARIAAGAVVLGGACIGPACQIRENAVVYGNVVLGSRVVVGPLSVIGRPGFGFTEAPDGRLVRVPQLGGVVIEDDVEIGPLCTVDSGSLGPTRIGAGAKLDAHVHVGHNVQIGAGCLVAGQAGFAGSACLGPGVRVGGQAGVTDHAQIGAGATIAAQSGVIGDIPPGAVVAGFPAVERMRWLRAMAKLLRL
jgi:UDP-3-O-[3-hydroxymyristoyl] glucosamine N-acyltransferase